MSYSLERQWRCLVPLPADSSFHVLSRTLCVYTGGSLDALDLSLAFDLCVDVPVIGDVCGADLAQYIPELDGVLPYVVFNQTVSLTSYVNCGSGSGTAAAPTDLPWAPKHGVVAKPSRCWGSSNNRQSITGDRQGMMGGRDGNREDMMSGRNRDGNRQGMMSHRQGIRGN